MTVASEVAILDSDDMSPEPTEELRGKPRRSTWWVGRYRENKTRSDAFGLISIGLLGLFSYKPFYEPDVETRGWDWLPYLALTLWVGMLLVGLFKLVKSFRLT